MLRENQMKQIEKFYAVVNPDKLSFLDRSLNLLLRKFTHLHLLTIEDEEICMRKVKRIYVET